MPWQPATATRKAAKAARRTARRAQTVNLCRREGPLLAPVKTSGITTVRAIVDSGAEESVTPPGLFRTPVIPTVMSKAGLTYTGANGAPIRNLGATEVRFADASGRARGIHFQVAEVKDPLISVAGLCDAGNEVVFDKTGGRIRHLKTGREIQLPRVGNSFVMDLHVPAKPEEEKKGSAPAFRRPE